MDEAVLFLFNFSPGILLPISPPAWQLYKMDDFLGGLSHPSTLQGTIIITGEGVPWEVILVTKREMGLEACPAKCWRLSWNSLSYTRFGIKFLLVKWP